MARAPCVPEGSVVYAIGDIHGRDDLLADLHDRIATDAAAVAAARRVLVHLGDYVDRGPASRQVVDRLSATALAGFETVALKGTTRPSCRPSCAAAGGGGLAGQRRRGHPLQLRRRPPDPWDEEDVERARTEFALRLPDRHRSFLDGLRLLHQEGDYLFVHAGIRPWAPLDRQVEADLLWIRDPFLDWTKPFGPVVVHGHTITRGPDVRSNRIGIDTGAYASGMLTCLVLEGAGRRFLHTGGA
jgi:serine/threonine protein phosphatase 1